MAAGQTCLLLHFILKRIKNYIGFKVMCEMEKAHEKALIKIFYTLSSSPYAFFHPF